MIAVKPLPKMVTRPDSIALKGGWDIVSPSLYLPAGVLRDVENFAVHYTGIGYERIGGYERFDGRAKPSDAVATLVQVTGFTNIPNAGDTLTGVTSGTTGIVLDVSTNDLYIVVTKTTGAFDTSEEVKVGATSIGTTTPLTVQPTAKQLAEYRNLAADEYRADIQAVPGSGPVRGVAGLVVSGADNLYAFRDNVGGTAVDLYKKSGSGWTQVPYYQEVGFNTGGTGVPSEGGTLSQGGNTATIKRVVLETGSWAGGDAAGRFIITAPTPASFTSGAATADGVGVTLDGAETAISFATGGRFEFVTANFTGASGTRRLYGCDGANRAFEFDGDVLTPITSGASLDQPKHLAEHRNHLLLAVLHSVLHSGAGEPYKFDGAEGGGEIAVGDIITNFRRVPGDQTVAAMCITGEHSLHFLYGNQKADFIRVPYKEGIGAYHYSAQSLDHLYLFDDLGLVDLQQTQDFGNFLHQTLTTGIKPYVEQKRTKVAYSALARDKNQYRIFFTDGGALYVTTLNGKFLGATRVVFPDTVFCVWEGLQGDGAAVSYFGAASGGMVYQLDQGSSFDGEAIQAWMELNWYYGKNPRQRKRFRRLGFYIEGFDYAEFQVGYKLGFGRSEIPQPSPETFESTLANPPYWDSFTWDHFFWDGNVLVPTEIPLNGTAENIQFRVQTTSDIVYPFTVSTLLPTMSDRRAVR